MIEAMGERVLVEPQRADARGHAVLGDPPRDRDEVATRKGKMAQLLEFG
jgi:hypothetical protein